MFMTRSSENHNLIQADTWVEKDGDILPSYTGPNFPKYNGVISKEDALEELRELHEPSTSAPINVVSALNTAAQERSTIIRPNGREGYTTNYIEGRERVLGGSKTYKRR